MPKQIKPSNCPCDVEPQSEGGVYGIRFRSSDYCDCSLVGDYEKDSERAIRNWNRLVRWARIERARQKISDSLDAVKKFFGIRT